MGAAIHTKRLQSEFLLLLAAIIWGLSFVAQRKGMEDIGPFAFNGIRFLLGALSLLPLAIWQNNKAAQSVPKPSAPYVKPGLVIGLILFLAASLQQIGMVYTTAGNAGFITSMYVVIVPIILVFGKHKTHLRTWIAAILALIGLYFLSNSHSFVLSKGDAFVFASAFFWALHVVFIARYAPSLNVIKLSVIQFLMCAVLSLITALVVETTIWEDVKNAAWPILYSGVLSVGLAFTLQVTAQRNAQASHAAIILSSESLFAAIGGWLILDEVMGGLKIFGACLMLLGILISQIKKNDL